MGVALVLLPATAAAGVLGQPTYPPLDATSFGYPIARSYLESDSLPDAQ